MNDNERDRIAAAIHQLRPDWPTASIRTILDRPAIKDRPRRDVAVALAWVACESTSQTPARVLEHGGDWWKAASVAGSDQGSANTLGYFDPTRACDVCSQPEHRHASTSGHDFLSTLDAARRREETPKPRLPRIKETR